MKFRVTETGSQTKSVSVAVEVRSITRFIEVDAEDEDEAVDIAITIDRGKWTKIADENAWRDILEHKQNQDQDPEPDEEDWSDAEEGEVEVEPVE